MKKISNFIDEWIEYVLCAFIIIFSVASIVTRDNSYLPSIQQLFILLIANKAYEIHKIVKGKFFGNIAYDKISVNINGTEVINTEPKPQYVSGTPVPLEKKSYDFVPVRARDYNGDEWENHELISVLLDDECYPYIIVDGDGDVLRFKYAEFI